MKCKIFFQFKYPPETMEDAVNEFLAATPNIEIIKLSQVVNVNNFLIMTIFYKLSNPN